MTASLVAVPVERLIIQTHMIGTRLAHYEITAHLGTGGMGEVYQASDSKLRRSEQLLTPN